MNFQVKTWSYLLKKKNKVFSDWRTLGRNSLLTFTGPVVGYVIEATMVQLILKMGKMMRGSARNEDQPTGLSISGYK